LRDGREGGSGEQAHDDDPGQHGGFSLWLLRHENLHPGRQNIDGRGDRLAGAAP
jgi:hypothetical protein